MDNKTIAKKFLQHAKQLEKEKDNLYRIRSWRQGAEAVLRLNVPLRILWKQKGKEALQKLSGIGSHLAFAIECLLTTGNYHAMTETAYRTERSQRVSNLPGVGPHLAQRLWEKFRIQSLSDLRTALLSSEWDRLPLSGKRKQQLLEILGTEPNQESIKQLQHAS